MTDDPNLSDPSLYINRELSWLAFNDGVLQADGLSRADCCACRAPQAPQHAHRTRSRAPSRRPAVGHHYQEQRDFRPRNHPGALRRIPCWRADPRDRARHLLPPPRNRRCQRHDRSPLHRRPLPRTFACLLFRERRQPDRLSRERRSHGAQSRPPSRDALPRPRSRRRPLRSPDRTGGVPRRYSSRRKSRPTAADVTRMLRAFHKRVATVI